MQSLATIIEESIRSHNSELQLFPRITENDVYMAIRQVMRDNPDIFWFSHQWHYSQTEAMVCFRYTIDKEHSEKVKRQIENVVQKDFKLTTEASNHSLFALYALGQCYEFGWGTPVDLNAAWECYSALRCERPGQSTFIDACTRVTSKMDNSNNHCSSKSIQVPQKLSKFQRLFKSLRQIICNH